jgi:hypothetical protein
VRNLFIPDSDPDGLFVPDSDPDYEDINSRTSLRFNFCDTRVVQQAVDDSEVSDEY